MSGVTNPGRERPVGEVRGTRDWMPDEYARLADLESRLLDRFARAGYRPMRIPVLEYTGLHERKSGAGIVSKLYELSGGGSEGICLRPELTAGIVRAYAEAAEPPALPWRVCVAGPVFRHEALRPGFDREFQQVGVEMLGAPGPRADAEVIWLADWALRESGVDDATIRIGHVGLILEMLERSGLPEAARATLVERLSQAASEGGNVDAIEAGLEHLAGWLGNDGEPEPPIGPGPEAGVDRLFRTLVPDVTGRRSGREILGRLRRKWELGHSLHEVIGRLRDRVRELADLRGPAPAILGRLEQHAALAPATVAALRELVAALGDYGVTPDRVELDLGFGRGIGFYSQMVFELVVPTPEGPIEVCGGGRYDGLARVLGSDRDDRGVGFAFGLERLAGAIARRGGGAVSHTPLDLIVAEAPEFLAEATRLATRLRSEGRHVLLDCDRSAPEAIEHAGRARLGRVLVVRGPQPLRTIDLNPVAEGR